MGTDDFTKIKTKAQKLCREHGACKKGYGELLKSGDLNSICSVMYEYWADMLGSFYEPYIAFLAEFYQQYKDDFNAAGLYFNETADNGRVVVTESIINDTFNGNAIVFVYNSAKITALGHTTVVAHDKSEITLGDYAKCQAYEKAKVFVNDFSSVKGYDFSRIEANGSVDIIAGGRCTVAALCYKRILACGNAQIYSRRKLNIRLLDQADLMVYENDLDIRNSIEYESSGN